MGHEFQSLYRVEARTWMWLIGLVFAVFIIFQYIELPYDDVMSSIVSSGKVPVAGNSSLLAGGASTNSKKVSSVNSTGSHAVDKAAYCDGTSEEKGADLDDNFVSEKSAPLNRSSRFDENRKPLNESFTKKSVELNNNSTNTDNSSSESESELDNKARNNNYHANNLSIGTNMVNKTAYKNGTSEEQDNILEDDSLSDGILDFNRSSGFDGDDKLNREPSPEKSGELNKNSVVKHADHYNGQTEAEEVVQGQQTHPHDNVTLDDNFSDTNSGEGNVTLTPQNAGQNGFVVSASLAFPPGDSITSKTIVEHTETNTSGPDVYISPETSLEEKNKRVRIAKNEHPERSKKDLTILGTDSSPANAPELNKDKTSLVATIAEMKTLLHESRYSSFSRAPKWSSAADKELINVRRKIENAPIVKRDSELYGPLYHNVSMFKRSYELMEETLKIYLYREGKKPVFHLPFLKGIYASEGWFMKQLETNKKYVTKEAKEAHLFYLPFSSRMLEETLYVVGSHSYKNLIQYLKDYIDMIAARYPFWNRTEGSDHFLVACHDWAPTETREYMANCIRALCNSDISEGYVFGKDVSLPETNVRSQRKPLKMLGGRPSSQRPILAFFAGKMHGYLRPILLEHWGDKDPDMKIFSRMPRVKGTNSYVQYMKSSKYCLCPRGYEVNSPRVVEAIFFECVPVIISDNYVPPFLEVLNWESFALFVLEKDIPNLKSILLSVPDSQYLQMQMMVKQVQKHFLWHTKPEKYDIFHMILHSIWYNRVFRIKPSY